MPKSRRCIWGQESYHYTELQSNISDFSVPKCKAIELVDPQEYYNQRGQKTFGDAEFPSGIENSLAKYFSLSGDIRKTYFRHVYSLAKDWIFGQ